MVDAAAQDMPEPHVPSIDREKREYFTQQLINLLSIDSGSRSFLLVLRQELFLVECFAGFAVVCDAEGNKIAQLPHTITHYSLIKNPSEPLVAFLTEDKQILLCHSDTNLSKCSKITLKSQLAISEVAALYVYRHENRYIISLFTTNGSI